MLDIDHGTYPYVTSSNATIGGVCTGLGVGAARHRRRARRGQGLHDARRRGAAADRADRRDGERLRESGRNIGAATGRPRRCGWYDAVAVRYAVRVNGLDALALTKLDVLDGLDAIEICTGYRIGGRTGDRVPVRPQRAGHDRRSHLRREEGAGRAPTKGARLMQLPPRRALRRAAGRGERRADRRSSRPAPIAMKRSFASGVVAVVARSRNPQN